MIKSQSAVGVIFAPAYLPESPVTAPAPVAPVASASVVSKPSWNIYSVLLVVLILWLVLKAL